MERFRAVAVVCNPPFNDRNWGYEELQYDARWTYDWPPKGESELAWVRIATPTSGLAGGVPSTTETFRFVRPLATFAL